ncbi:hypothetical protein CONPUDRAFT_144751 [Coniophora puteana RWD-64-598 SS2]|uniref:Uncharacterized protein n=1 Tax=Coniophora puteana (strain RWD-64-598) TaxID=741705 RepID=A0A5M3MJP1_CONPW|nr:uncharacterized protein CONPUDRAFT_144751 [Coniophora puteana RWD-64-598 SS2]EIW79458.1 hypothetical protein CONPUDRAFT_144751 [Coniophora puteana RWD-64-598 SS2]
MSLSSDIQLPPSLLIGTPAEQVSKIDLYTRQLRCYRNSLLWVCRFPPETLGHIFVRYVEPDHALEKLKTVTSVCQHWRDVALNTPRLWATIVFHGDHDVSRAELWMERARGMPIEWRTSDNVRLKETSESFKLIEKLLRQPARIHHLELPLSSIWNGEIMFADTLGASNAAPLLHTLHLSYHGFEFDSFIPHTPFGGNTPNLRNLSLYRCAIPWTSPIFSQLQSLTLSSLPHPITPTGQELLDLLRVTTSLQELRLHWSLPQTPISHSTWTSDNSIELPFLRHLSLSKGSFDGYSFLLRNVQFPPSTHIQLSGITLDRPLGETTLLPPKVFNIPQFTSPITLQVGWLDTFHVQLHTHRCPRPFFSDPSSNVIPQCTGPGSIGGTANEPSWPCRIRLDASFALDYLPPGQGLSFEPRLAALLCRGVPFAVYNIATLCVYTPTEEAGSERAVAWAELFACVPQVRRLDVTFRTRFLKDVLRALEPGGEEDGPGDGVGAGTGTGTVLLRGLEEVHLRPHRHDAYPVQDCARVLRARQEAGAMVQRLVIEQHQEMAQRDKRDLERVVGEVIYAHAPDERILAWLDWQTGFQSAVHDHDQY